jgi:hypothetical protein
VETYYRLHCQTRKKHGLPPQSYAFFKSIYRNVISTGLGFVVTAKFQQVAIAGAVFFQFGNRGLFKFGASDESYLPLRGNDLVMWQGIQTLAQRGCRDLHFGRTSKLNEGLRRFKCEWGAKEQVIDYCRYDLKKSAFVRDSDRASGWHTPLFRFAPLWLARLAGSLLYGRMA